MSTRQQRWSLAAHKAVKSFRGDTDASKLKPLCMKAPALIQRSGAVQAVAFLQSRKHVGDKFTDALAGVLTPGEKGQNLLERAQNMDLPEYLALTRDLLEVAAWFRRFAQVELGDVEEEEG